MMDRKKINFSTWNALNEKHKAQLKEAIDAAYSEGMKNGQIVAGRREETWHYNNRILPLQALYKQFGVD